MCSIVYNSLLIELQQHIDWIHLKKHPIRIIKLCKI